MKYVIIFISLLLPNFAFAADFPENLDFFTSKGLPGKFIRIHDPGYIVIELEQGVIIDTTYSGVEFDILYEWEKQQEKTGIQRKIHVTYTNATGVMVKDIKSSIQFKLNGVMETHPIDIAVDECENTYSNTIGMKGCRSLALAAWDAELNRAYKELGGSNNIKLKTSQLAWIKYKDTQIEYLRSEYGARQGTIWGIVYMNHVVNITKNQTQLLKSIKEW